MGVDDCCVANFPLTAVKVQPYLRPNGQIPKCPGSQLIIGIINPMIHTVTYIAAHGNHWGSLKVLMPTSYPLTQFDSDILA